MLDERQLEKEYQQQYITDFSERIRQFDAQKAVEMRAKGWIWIKTPERTVTFSFGTVTFERRVYRKGSEWKCPVDEYLGLDSHSRFSEEMKFQISEISTDLSCRKGAKQFERLKGIYIGKNVVCKVKKYVRRLQKEKKEFNYYKDVDLIEKIKVKTLYLEGDGVRLKTIKGDEVSNTDFAHYVVHEGVEKEYGKRNKTIGKHETFSINLSEAKEEMIDYVHGRYDITENTLLITNSDMGIGYQAQSFEEIAALFKCRHEHFWDVYHLNKEIKERLKKIKDKDVAYNLRNRLYNAIRIHDINEAQIILDTAESLFEEEQSLELFQKFSIRLIKNWKYTKPAELRGLSTAGIGVMETQHVKITDRMKHRGMYWSLEGAETMGKMIIEKTEGSLRDLFFGKWRKEYAHYQALPATASTHLKPSRVSSGVKKGNIISKRVRKIFK